MSLTLLWIALIIAGLDWVAVAIKFRALEYIAKPGVMIVLLIWIWTLDGFTGSMVWFGLGALFSLGGDVFLMLPQERFIAGLISFLLAHIAYFIGFNQQYPPINIASLIILVIVILTAAGFYGRIAKALSVRDQRKLRLPVLSYTVVISLMLLSALITLVRADDEWAPYPALSVSAGALLFFISDAILAWNKFVESLDQARLKTMIAYHLGQLGILLGAALHYLR